MFKVHSKVIQLYTYIIFKIIFHNKLLQDIDYRSLYYTINFCCWRKGGEEGRSRWRVQPEQALWLEKSQLSFHRVSDIWGEVMQEEKGWQPTTPGVGCWGHPCRFPSSHIQSALNLVIPEVLGSHLGGV